MRAQGTLPEPGIEADEARRIADDVLSDAAYRDTEPLLDRALRVLGEALGEVLGQLTRGGAGSAVAWIILAGLVVGLAMVLRNVIGPVPTFARAAPPSTVVTEGAERRSAAGWRALADGFEADGAYDEAVRARYRAAVAELVEAGALADVAGTTPGEYRRQLLADDDIRSAPFAEMTDLFESVWYGPADAVAGDLDRFRRWEADVATVAVGAT